MSVPATKGRVLVVEDAPEYRELIVGALRRHGFDVLSATTGAEGLRLAAEHGPLLVVLDLTLPGLDGMEVCRRLHEASDVFVVMVTSRDDEVDRVLGLRTGADDYLTKPFSTRELITRIDVLLRRHRRTREAPPAAAATDERSIGPLLIRPLARELEVDGVMVELTRIEFDLLDALTENPRIVRPRAALRERVWGADWFGDDHVVDVHISNLRKKIDRGRDRSLIRTVRGVGYGMAP